MAVIDDYEKGLNPDKKKKQQKDFIEHCKKELEKRQKLHEEVSIK